MNMLRAYCVTNLPSPTVTAIGIFSEPAVVWENRWVVTVGGELLE